MLEAAEQAVQFCQGRSESDMFGDQILAFALRQCVQVIGEAASKISSVRRAELPEIPWVQIIATRHRLVHAYWDTDYVVIWETATEDVPALIPLLRAALDC